MAKLRFIFKNEKEDWTNLDKTEWLLNIQNGNSTLYVGTKETRTLRKMAEEIERELIQKEIIKNGEKVELNEFDKEIINFEEEQKQKVNSSVYNLCKMGFNAVKQKKTTWEHLINLFEESRCI